MRPLLIALPLLGLLAGPALASAEPKIAYVDTQRALQEVEEFKIVRDQLKAKFDRSQRQLDQKQQELLGRREELRKKSLAMDEDTLRQQQEELERDMIELSGLATKLQRELSEEERKLVGEMQKKMGAVVQQIAEQGGYTYILDAAAVLYAPPALDITNELIRRYNAANKAGSKKK